MKLAPIGPSMGKLGKLKGIKALPKPHLPKLKLIGRTQ
jgi:hypothetical protein